MPKVRKRKWYLVWRLGNPEPTYFVSAFSVSSVVRGLNLLPSQYKILPGKAWWLAKIMSGEPCGLPEVTNLAPATWLMVNDGVVYQVFILN